jgi:predicted nucleic acid-binding protein
VNAHELLRSDAPYVADTSAWWRASTLPGELRELLKNAVRDDRLWITPIVRMEILYSARTTSEYVALELELDALRILRNDRAVADSAMSALAELAGHNDGYHRVPLTDALIAEPQPSTADSRCCTSTPTSTASARRSPSKASPSQDRDHRLPHRPSETEAIKPHRTRPVIVQSERRGPL